MRPCRPPRPTLAEVEAQFGSARDEAQGLIDRERSQRQTAAGRP